MPTMNDNQYNDLKNATDSVEPVYNKLTSGDTNLTGDEMSRFTDAYQAWHEFLDSSK